MPRFCVSEGKALRQALNDYNAASNDWTDAFLKQAAGELADCLKKWDNIGVLDSKHKNLLQVAEQYR